MTKVLLACALVMLFALSVSAMENGGELEYALNSDGTYSVVGIGAYVGTDIVIPSTYNGAEVTRIENSAFKGNTEITSVTIPDSVKSIGAFAFHYCTALEGVSLGNGVKTVEDSAFYYCTSLENLDLGKSVEKIERYSFYNCTDLDTVQFPDSLAELDYGAFSHCDNIIQIKLGTGLVTVADTAFANCLKVFELYNPCNLTFPKKVDYKKYTAGEKEPETYYTVAINGLAIAVYNHTDLSAQSQLIWTDNGYVFSVHRGEYCLVSHTGNDTELTLPSDINGSSYKIFDFAFHNRTSLKGVNLGSGVTSIGNAAFNFSGITEITIPSSVTKIGAMAFNDCHLLERVYIADTVTEIGYGTFQRCYLLKSIKLPSGIKTIDIDTFCECFSLSSIVLPRELILINSYAFAECSSLVSVTLPSKLGAIGNYAFAYCDNLQYVYIPKSVAVISEKAFSACPRLTVYCEAQGAGDGWDASWNDGVNVNWNATVALEDAFSFLGYSTDGKRISAGYSIDYVLLDLYKELSSSTIDFGLVFASYELLGGKTPLNDDASPTELDIGKVIKVSLTEWSYTVYDFIMVDLTQELYSHKFVIAGYTYDGTEITYIQEEKGGAVSGKSYNDMMENAEENANEEICCPVL